MTRLFLTDPQMELLLRCLEQVLVAVLPRLTPDERAALAPIAARLRRTKERKETKR